MNYYRKIPLKAFGEHSIIKITKTESIRHNYRLFSDMLAKTNTICACVMKSSIHGTDIRASAPVLYDEGCRHYFVEDLSEGIILRKLLPYSDAIIYETGGFLRGEENYFNDYNITPCLNCIEEIKRWNNYCKENGRRNAVIHFDTGMNRMGLPEYEALQLKENFEELTSSFEIEFYMSHFYDIKSDDLSSCFKQARRLEKFLEGLPKRPISFHATDSAVMLRDKGLNYDMARIGIGLVGGGPSINHIIDPTSEMSVEYYAKLSQVKKVKKGDTIGYAGAYTAKRDMKIALAHVGYNDGYLRYLSEMDKKPIGAYMAVCGIKTPVVGKISLGVTTIDVTDVPDELLKDAVCVEVIGPNVDARVLAEISGCYEVFGSLGRPNVKTAEYTEIEIEKLSENENCMHH
ncbi:MAG: alanine racemase [Eubacteriales bacterium]|nr:alanine racemase [Eubacteriales bacterium]MDD4474170.1 alanine racemase [Eubacteriales bacterium]